MERRCQELAKTNGELKAKMSDLESGLPGVLQEILGNTFEGLRDEAITDLIDDRLYDVWEQRVSDYVEESLKRCLGELLENGLPADAMEPLEDCDS